MIKFEEFPGSKKHKQDINLNTITLVSIFIILVSLIIVSVFISDKYVYKKNNDTENVIYLYEN